MKDLSDSTDDRRIAPSGGDRPHPSTIGKTTVEGLVWAEVEKVEWETPNAEGREGRYKSRRGELILGALTFAYAMGIYRSSEIELELLRSPEAMAYFEEHPMTRQSLRQFRRLNKDLIKRCLRNVFDCAVKAKGNRPKAALLGTGGQQPLPTTIESALRLPLATREAEERVRRAIEEDHMDSED